MPELPEVEVICQGLRPHLVDRNIIDIKWSDKKLRLPIPHDKLLALVKGTTIVAVERRAKYILINLSNQCRLVVHLGMTGKLGVFKVGSPVALHDHLCLFLADNMELRLNDTRRFGFVVVQEGLAAQADPFPNLGPDPFWPEFTGEHLKEEAGRRLQPVKNFLMDNKVVVGIGNIYANEILFQAGIQPTTPIGSLGLAAWQNIVEISRQILAKAIKSGGTTISDYLNASGEPGYFQLQLAVYGRNGQQCQQCDEIIEKLVIAGRATFFCPGCQK